MSGRTKKGFDLTRIPPLALREIADAIQSGDEKYERWDWVEMKDGSEDVSAAMRHISHFLHGHDRDQESGLLHLAHAAARLCYVIERQMLGETQGAWRRPMERKVPASTKEEICAQCGLPWSTHLKGETRHHDPVCPKIGGPKS